jgi:hypothetical protein
MKQPAAPSVLQACRQAPVLGIESFPWGVMAQMQKAWLPGRCIRPVRDPVRQEDQLPANRAALPHSRTSFMTADRHTPASCRVRLRSLLKHERN